MLSGLDAVRVVDEKTAAQLCGLSLRTWDRMRARGETPPLIQLSARRIGYRLVDINKWLDARRQPSTAALKPKPARESRTGQKMVG